MLPNRLSAVFFCCLLSATISAASAAGPFAASEPAATDVVCTRGNLPSGKSDSIFLVFENGDARIALLSRGPGVPGKASLLAKGLKCVQAASDFRVVNCLRPTPPGSVFRADATFTILHHRMLSAGPIKREVGGRGEAGNGGEAGNHGEVVSESYAVYFRDDRNALELKWNLSTRTCRAATTQERELVLVLE